MNRKKNRNIFFFYNVAWSWGGWIGFGMEYIAAFIIFLGASNSQVGYLMSLPFFVGSLVGFFSTNIADRMKNRRMITFWGVVVQSIMFGVLCILVFCPNRDITIFVSIVIFMICHSATYFIHPSWTSWVGDILPKDKRGQLWGIANMVGYIAAIISILLAGIILGLWDNNGYKYLGFFAIFAIAFLWRTSSATFVYAMSEPLYVVQKSDYFSFLDFIRGVTKSNFVKFSLYVAFLHLAIYVAAPFFAVYMLNELNFTPLEYGITVASHYIGLAIGSIYFGKFADKNGSKKALSVTGWGLVMVPFLWSILSFPLYLYFAHFYAGIVYGGFATAINIFLLDAVTPQKRVRCQAYLNVFMGTGIFLGGVLGGWLAENLPKSISITYLGFGIMFSSLIFVFIISGISRFLANFIFLRRFKKAPEFTESEG